jgi:hypothetical protein
MKGAGGFSHAVILLSGTKDLFVTVVTSETTFAPNTMKYPSTRISFHMLAFLDQLNLAQKVIHSFHVSFRK